MTYRELMSLMRLAYFPKGLSRGTFPLDSIFPEPLTLKIICVYLMQPQDKRMREEEAAGERSEPNFECWEKMDRW